MARSDGDRPRAAPSQARRVAVDSATWNTGTPAPSSGVCPLSPRAEKEVAFTIAAGRSAVTQRAIQRAAPGAFSDGANSPSTSNPLARSAVTSA